MLAVIDPLASAVSTHVMALLAIGGGSEDRVDCSTVPSRVGGRKAPILHGGVSLADGRKREQCSLNGCVALEGAAVGEY